MTGFLAGLSPKAIGGLLIALLLSVSACIGTGYMLVKSHERRGELAEALKTQREETRRAAQVATENAEALKSEREAWDKSTRIYNHQVETANAKAEKLGRELGSAKNATNDRLPDAVFDSLPK